MKDNINNAEQQKAYIRKRYKGNDSNEVEVIPALPIENIYDSNAKKRIAIYVRVSTDDSSQTSSFELQKNYYTDFVSQHPSWILVGIYADEGISGTSLKHRDAFIKMIQDCRDGKIDLIVTKSVSRFARNILDCISYVRQLSALHPPVGVIFEIDDIYTLDGNSESALSNKASSAQEESHTKSKLMNASVEMRFKRGILLTPPLLGYDQNEKGKLIINRQEAETVRLIFLMYLYGYTCVQIADKLTKLGRQTKKKNTVWSPGAVLKILQNERHCGDILARKTWTPNYLDHKSRKNKGNKNQYKWKDTHENIISRDIFIAVQRLISNAKYGNKGILPELKVIHDGVLKGFVPINPRWAAFSSDDYLSASKSAYDNEDIFETDELKIEVQSGDIDLRGFEVARLQFFDTAQKSCVTFTPDYIVFSTGCIRKFDKVMYIEMLVNPEKQLFVVRPCTKETKNAVKWSTSNVDGQYYACHISCVAYIKTLYKLFDWDISCKYRVHGICRKKEHEVIAVFDLSEHEMFMPQKILETDLLSDNIQPFTNGQQKDIRIYPTCWANNFGSNYYRHAQAHELAAFAKHGTWNICEEGLPFPDSQKLNITNYENIRSEIDNLIYNMQLKVDENDK